MWLEPMPNGGIITRVLPGDDSQVLQARVPSPVPTPFGRGLRRTSPAGRAKRTRTRTASSRDVCNHQVLRVVNGENRRVGRV